MKQAIKFKGIREMLKRDEMKRIMGGSGITLGCQNDCDRVWVGWNCSSGGVCQVVACGGQQRYYMCL